jgi:DNA-binding response OmpR family regulator
MDLRVVVLTTDKALGELIRAQADNLGCRCTIAATYEEASTSLSWAEAAVVDLVDDGVEMLCRLRIEAPRLRVLAVSPDAEAGAAAASAGADRVLSEPFSIPELADALRAVGGGVEGVIDLRVGAAAAAPRVADDSPWWATR